ncbi:MAG TPA: DUF4097 family beta strand repeat-containing protein [Streptosporangiaceae bacterium]|nr:DUF4097 family beta strand repeat-containing protein [Streptosporangiaceae bacterium]
MSGTATPLPMTPARRFWLAIGTPVCLVLAGWIGLNLVALVGQGQFPVSHDIPPGAGQVTVNVSEGRVHLQGAAGGQAQLTGTAHYTLVRPSFTTKVTTSGPDFGYDCKFPVGNCDLDATVRVPRATAASVHTGGGDATVSGTAGDVTVTTDGGSVSAEQVSGNLTLTTNGGDITASAITAPRVTATTAGGDVTVVFTRVPVIVDVTTDGGRITIVVPPGRTHYHLTEHTGGGTTSGQIPTDSSSPNVITATTGGGDITVRQS